MRISDIVREDYKTIIGGCPICNGFAKLWELIGYPIYVKTMRNNIKMLSRELNPDDLLMQCAKYKKSYPFRKIKDYCFVPAGDMPSHHSTTKEAMFTQEELIAVFNHVLKPRSFLESAIPEKVATSENTMRVPGLIQEALNSAMREIEEFEDAHFMNFIQGSALDRRPAIVSFVPDRELRARLLTSLSAPHSISFSNVVEMGRASRQLNSQQYDILSSLRSGPIIPISIP